MAARGRRTGSVRAGELFGQHYSGRHQQRQGGKLGDGEKRSDFTLKIHSGRSRVFPHLDTDHAGPRSDWGHGGGPDLPLHGA